MARRGALPGRCRVGAGRAGPGMALLLEHEFRPLPADKQIETLPFLEAVAHLPPFFGKSGARGLRHLLDPIPDRTGTLPPAGTERLPTPAWSGRALSGAGTPSWVPHPPGLRPSRSRFAPPGPTPGPAPLPRPTEGRCPAAPESCVRAGRGAPSRPTRRAAALGNGPTPPGGVPGENGAERGRTGPIRRAAQCGIVRRTGTAGHGANPARCHADPVSPQTAWGRPSCTHPSKPTWPGTSRYGGAPPHARGCGTGARPWAPTRTPHLCALAENPGRLRLQPQQVQNAAEHPGGGEGDARRCLAQDGRYAGADVAEEVTMFVHRPWAQPGMWGWGSRRARGQSATPHRVWGSKARGHCTSLPLPAGG